MFTLQFCFIFPQRDSCLVEDVTFEIFVDVLKL